VLLLDEADAIASPRSTSVDLGFQRESNTFVSVLLQELERFNGVVIFATKLAVNFDPAFERRIWTHVLFEMPGRAGPRERPPTPKSWLAYTTFLDGLKTRRKRFRSCEPDDTPATSHAVAVRRGRRRHGASRATRNSRTRYARLRNAIVTEDDAAHGWRPAVHPLFIRAHLGCRGAKSRPISKQT